MEYVKIRKIIPISIHLGDLTDEINIVITNFIKENFVGKSLVEGYISDISKIINISEGVVRQNKVIYKVEIEFDVLQIFTNNILEECKVIATTDNMMYLKKFDIIEIIVPVVNENENKSKINDLVDIRVISRCSAMFLGSQIKLIGQKVDFLMPKWLLSNQLYTFQLTTVCKFDNSRIQELSNKFQAIDKFRAHINNPNIKYEQNELTKMFSFLIIDSITKGGSIIIYPNEINEYYDRPTPELNKLHFVEKFDNQITKGIQFVRHNIFNDTNLDEEMNSKFIINYVISSVSYPSGYYYKLYQTSIFTEDTTKQFNAVIQNKFLTDFTSRLNRIYCEEEYVRRKKINWKSKLDNIEQIYKKLFL